MFVLFVGSVLISVNTHYNEFIKTYTFNFRDGVSHDYKIHDLYVGLKIIIFEVEGSVALDSAWHANGD